MPKGDALIVRDLGCSGEQFLVSSFCELRWRGCEIIDGAPMVRQGGERKVGMHEDADVRTCENAKVQGCKSAKIRMPE